MIINSNDIFRQIGLAVDPHQNKQKLKKSNFKSKPQYVICLQIQLSEDEKYIMEVNDADDPSAKATQFCQKHKLNKLAANLVQAKIRQAKQVEQQKLKKSRFKSNINSNKPNNDSLHHFKNAARAKQLQERNHAGNKSPFKHFTSRNQQRQTEMKQDYSKSKSKSRQKSQISKTASSDNIYLRSVVKSRLLEEQRNKMKVQIQKKQQEKLTFKPKINNVSEKIVQFLRTNQIPKQKKSSPPKKMYEQMKQCTFKPKLNKVSERIINNKSALRQQRQNHKNLFKDSAQIQQKTNKKIMEQQFPFRPQINPKSAQKVTIPFFKRLQITQQKKNKISNQQFLDDEQYSFHPKVGRGPLRGDRNKQNLNIWEYLYNGSKKDSSHVCLHQHLESHTFKQSTTSQQYYENLIEERINQVYKILDSDNDGLISPNQIAIQLLPTECLQFLKPIFMQMDEIDATLNFYQFKKAIQALLADSDPGSRGAFLSSKWKKQLQERSSFKPSINKKSRQMSVNRSVQNLYKQGLKQKQNRQYRLQKERALKQQKQLEQCLFKPVLNHSSKVYIQKIARKKTQNNPARSISDLLLNQSQMQNSDNQQ